MSADKRNIAALLQAYVTLWPLPVVARAKIFTLLNFLGVQVKVPEPSWQRVSGFSQFLNAALAVAGAPNMRIGKAFVASVGEAISAAFQATCTIAAHDLQAIASDRLEAMLLTEDDWEAIAASALNAAMLKHHGMSLLMYDPQFVTEEGRSELLHRVWNNAKLIHTSTGRSFAADLDFRIPDYPEHHQIRGRWRRWQQLACDGAWDKDSQLREDAWDFFAHRVRHPDEPPSKGLEVAPGLWLRLSTNQVLEPVEV